MSAAARSVQRDFDWPRYHKEVVDAIEDLEQRCLEASHRGSDWEKQSLQRACTPR